MITQQDIDTFVAAVQAKHDQRFAELGYSWKETYSASVGPKYVRVIQQMPAQRSVFCFIDRATGDILKAASWAAPAKHARGNIANGVADLTPDGRVRYL